MDTFQNTSFYILGMFITTSWSDSILLTFIHLLLTHHSFIGSPSKSLVNTSRASTSLGPRNIQIRHDFLSWRSHHTVWPLIQVLWQSLAYGTQAVTSRDMGTETPRSIIEEAWWKWTLGPVSRAATRPRTAHLLSQTWVAPSAKYKIDIWLLLQRTEDF